MATGGAGMVGTGGAGEEPPIEGTGGEGTGGEPSWSGVPVDEAQRILFIGNSYTYQGPVAEIVRDLATSVGWPTPEVHFSAVGGQSLTFHRSHQETLDLVEAGDWNFVVLQDFSTRPTDNQGDPETFKEDATWFFDSIKETSNDAQVLLYETWARHPASEVYPADFADPLEMQSQLRFHYNDAAYNYVPLHSLVGVDDDLSVAPVGDAWEFFFSQPDSFRLHDADNSHGNDHGWYLNSAVLYSMIYGVVATGASELYLPVQDAVRLQAAADETTGITVPPPAFP